MYCFFSVFISSAQTFKENLLTSIEKDNKIPEENIFIQVNKSILLQGEDLGFAAYIYDQKNRKPSAKTKNIYCELINSEGKIIKKQLLLADNGKAYSTFAIDSLVSAGDYTLRGYTNWMRNFKKSLFAEVSLRVATVTSPDVKNNLKNNTIDIQLLPEGGRAVDNVMTVVGVIAKDHYGKGVQAEIFLHLASGSQNIVKLDDKGIGRFTWLPTLNAMDSISATYNEKPISVKMPKIEPMGTTLSTKTVGDIFFVELKTNAKTKKLSQKLNYTIAVTNSQGIGLFEVQLKDLKTVLPLTSQSLSEGMNEVSVFDAFGKLVATRLHYNYIDPQLLSSSSILVNQELDSLKVSMKFENKARLILSASILPDRSIAATVDNSIASKFLLQPYLNGYIQNPLYYLKNINRRVKYDMDNLLLTQGWRVYDWDQIFEARDTYNYAFENGIVVRATTNDKDDSNFMIHAGRQNGSDLIELEPDSNDFILTGYIPTTNEKLRISSIDKK